MKAKRSRLEVQKENVPQRLRLDLQPFPSPNIDDQLFERSRDSNVVGIMDCVSDLTDLVI